MAPPDHPAPADSDGYVVRLARPEDEPAVARLFSEVFGAAPDAGWRRRYDPPPGGGRCWVVLEHEQAVVGQVIYVLFPGTVDGQPVLIGAGADAMVHPDHRGHNGLRRMQAHQQAADYDMRLAFPVDQVTSMARRERSERVSRLPLWVRWLTATGVAASRPGTGRPLAATVVGATTAVASVASRAARLRWRIEPVTEPDDRFDALARRSAGWARAIRRRDAAYIRYRWLDRADGARPVLAAVDRRGRLGGWVVTAPDPRAGRRMGCTVGHVVDLLAAGPGPHLALLGAACRQLQATGADVVLFDHQDRRRWAAAATRLSGFAPRGTGVNAISHHNERFRHVPYVAPGDWYLTFGDTDLC